MYDAYGLRHVDHHGQHVETAANYPDMHQPARCAFCGRVYDLGTVTVTARYVDCSVWKTPCCNRTADDRGETGWKSRSDYTRLPGGKYMP